MNGPPKSRESSISVAVRVRPFTQHEQQHLVESTSDEIFLGSGSFNSNEATKRPLQGIRKIIDVVDEKMLIFDPPSSNPLIKMHTNAFPNKSNNTSRIREHRFVFDRLFDENSSQDDIFTNTTKPLLSSVLDGFNSTVFAYGATGCGKTHTISGTPNDPGLIFLTMKELYKMIDDLSDIKVFDISLSFLEIYNETIRDLLNPSTNFKKLILREDLNSKISVSNLSSHKPKSVQDVMNLLITGNSNRMTSPTDANATSSRSHAVLQINIDQSDKLPDLNQQHTFATLSIIDLAGSERAASTKNRGARLNEGANINKSLLALGNCINALCDGTKRQKHIPYRDSKLTRLLKFSLGGNCKTVMIVCISPSSQHYDETLNTLKYADRAKEIKTKLVRNNTNLNRHVGSYLKMITEQKLEIEQLRTRETNIINKNLHQLKKNHSDCLKAIIQAIAEFSSSLQKQFTEKWNIYFLLAKRKLLLGQYLEIKCFLEERSPLNSSDRKWKVITELGYQLISKLDSQIHDLEARYLEQNEVDYLFSEKSQHVLRKLSELNGWTEEMSDIYNLLMKKERDSYDRDILFHSSTLFDQMLDHLDGFRVLTRELAHAIDEDVTDNIILIFELLNGSDMDVDIENCALELMQARQNETDFGNTLKRSGSPTNMSSPNIKRHPNRFNTPKASPNKFTRRLQGDISMLDSDVSGDDSILQEPDSDYYPTIPVLENLLPKNDVNSKLERLTHNAPSSLAGNFNKSPSTNGRFHNPRFSFQVRHNENDEFISKLPLPSKSPVQSKLLSLKKASVKDADDYNDTPVVGGIVDNEFTTNILPASPASLAKLDSPTKIRHQFTLTDDKK